MIPGQVLNAVIISAKMARVPLVSHAAEKRADLTPISGIQATTANITTTGIITIPEYAVNSAAARTSAVTATISPRLRLKPVHTTSHVAHAVSETDIAS